MGSLIGFVCLVLNVALLVCCQDAFYFSDSRLKGLKEKSKEMFFHAYNSYVNFAYPADELMPLSCKGRYRDTEPSRGTEDEVLGNFSLSLIDSLDALFLFGELDKFESAVLRVVHNVSFDQNIYVSVFETNIRVLGGLLGGHVSVLALREKDFNRMSWYKNQLLDMAVDLGNRLLPAFNTSTGLPFPRINLRTGKPSPRLLTCTACAGTFILEFTALSRFSGNPVYETKAANALSYLWQQRNRYSNLVGTEINVSSGEWVRRESGVGAGIDSYYESLLKAYSLLGDPVYLHRFQTHYSAVERYMGAPGTKAFPFSFLSVYMHKPSERSRAYMDALQAFWPGLQTINGDVNAAVAHHEMIFLVHKEHGLLPEAFTTDMGIYWPYYLIRPELVESTYLLYKTTGDPYYLYVGSELLESVERHTRVPCGFAAIEDIRTMKHSDRMDSFVLAETFKYFHLLFSEPFELPIDLERYVLTTEAHILPINLPRNQLPVNPQTEATTSVLGSYGHAWSSTCAAPSRLAIFQDLLHSPPGTCHLDSRNKEHQHFETIRELLRSMARNLRSKHAAQDHAYFSLISGSLTGNVTHLQKLRQMGVTMTVGKNGEVHLQLDRSQAESPLLGLSGLKLMEEVIDLANARTLEKSPDEAVKSHTIALIHPPHFGRTRFEAGPSLFTFYPGELLNSTNNATTAGTPSNYWEPVVGPLVIAEPFDACKPVYSTGTLLANKTLHTDFVESSFDGDIESADSSTPGLLLKGAIVLVKRGGCTFVEKAINVKQMGARGVIAMDGTPGTSSAKDKLFYMSAESPDGSTPKELLQLPFVFVFHEEGKALVSAMKRRWMSEREPALAIIAKQKDLPKILTQGLRYLDSISQLKTEQRGQCFELSTDVAIARSLCAEKGEIRADEARWEENGEWNITLGSLDDMDTFNLINTTSGRAFPNDPGAWIDLMDRNWPTTSHEKYCKDLVLAVSEAALDQIIGTEEPSQRSSVVKLSRHWRDRVSECLRGLSAANTNAANHGPCLRLGLKFTLAILC